MKNYRNISFHVWFQVPGNVFLDVPLSDSVVENADVAFLVDKLK